jgi:flagellar biosynthesis/type III secretory pathway M-ring protein FliF/YscJ
MPATDSFLQYGAMGLLAAVLALLGVVGREVLRRESVRSEKRESLAEERRAQHDLFVQQLRTEDREDRRLFTETLTDLVKQGTDADVRVAEQLENICKMQAEHEKESAARTEEWQSGIVGILEILERIDRRHNGG